MQGWIKDWYENPQAFDPTPYNITHQCSTLVNGASKLCLARIRGQAHVGWSKLTLQKFTDHGSTPGWASVSGFLAWHYMQQSRNPKHDWVTLLNLFACGKVVQIVDLRAVWIGCCGPRFREKCVELGTHGKTVLTWHQVLFFVLEPVDSTVNTCFSRKKNRVRTLHTRCPRELQTLFSSFRFQRWAPTQNNSPKLFLSRT